MTLRITPTEIVDAAETSGKPGLMSRAPGWPRVRLGDVVRVVNGAPYESSLFNKDGDGMPLVRIRDISADAPSTWYSGEWEELHLVLHGDILVGMDGDFNLSRWKNADAVLNQRVCRLDVDNGRYDDRFLTLVLPGYLRAIWNRTSATTVKHLSSRSVADIPLPFPSMCEQRRIVDVLEDHLSRLDAGSQGLVAARRRMQAMVSSSLARLFGSRDAKIWTLGKAVTMTSGGTPRAGNKEYYNGGSIPWVNSGDLKDREIAQAPKFITEAGLRASSAKWIPEGSVLMAMYGATIGRLGILSQPMTTNQAIACMTPFPELNRDYLYWFLFSQRHAFVKSGKGGAQPNISQTILKSWPMPVPGLDEQAEVVQRVRRLAESTRRFEEQADVLDRRAQALRRALLTAAFSGRLTGRSTDTEVVEEIANSQGAA